MIVSSPPRLSFPGPTTAINHEIDRIFTSLESNKERATVIDESTQGANINTNTITNATTTNTNANANANAITNTSINHSTNHETNTTNAGQEENSTNTANPAANVANHVADVADVANKTNEENTVNEETTAYSTNAVVNTVFLEACFNITHEEYEADEEDRSTGNLTAT